MRRLAYVFFAIAMALMGFYVGWPAWTAHQISMAIRDENPDLLASKVDFTSVQASLRPFFATELEKGVERLAREQGPLGGLIAAGLKGDIGQRLLDRAIVSGVTPNNVIRMAREGRNMREALQKIFSEQMGKGAATGSPPSEEGARADEAAKSKLGNILGRARQGTGGPAPKNERDPPQPAPQQDQQATPKRQLGLANIKSVALNGPVALTIGIARDKEAKEADLLVHFALTGGDWKVVGLTPRVPPN